MQVPFPSSPRYLPMTLSFNIPKFRQNVPHPLFATKWLSVNVSEMPLFLLHDLVFFHKEGDFRGELFRLVIVKLLHFSNL